MGRLSSRDRKLAHTAGMNVNTIEHRNFAPFSSASSQLFLQSPLPVTPTTGILLVSEVAYWTYLGYTQKTLVVDAIKGIQTVAAVAGGTPQAELALATTPSAPNGTGQSLTVTNVVTYSGLEDLTAGGLPAIRGTTSTSLGWTVSPCTHLWAGMRAEMGTNPTMLGVAMDLGAGFAQATALAASPLAVGTTYAGTIVFTSVENTATHPLLRCTIRE